MPHLSLPGRLIAIAAAIVTAALEASHSQENIQFIMAALPAGWCTLNAALHFPLPACAALATTRAVMCDTILPTAKQYDPVQSYH
jgi:hypothetical protein